MLSCAHDDGVPLQNLFQTRQRYPDPFTTGLQTFGCGLCLTFDEGIEGRLVVVSYRDICPAEHNPASVDDPYLVFVDYEGAVYPHELS